MFLNQQMKRGSVPLLLVLLLSDDCVVWIVSILLSLRFGMLNVKVLHFSCWMRKWEQDSCSHALIRMGIGCGCISPDR